MFSNLDPCAEARGDVRTPLVLRELEAPPSLWGLRYPEGIRALGVLRKHSARPAGLHYFCSKEWAQGCDSISDAVSPKWPFYGAAVNIANAFGDS